MSRCRSCDAEIVWAETVNGKKIPLDAGHHLRGVRVKRDDPLILADEGDVRAGNAVIRAVPTYVSHFATCPNAAEHRKGRPR